MRAILSELASWAREVLGDEFVAAVWPPVLSESGPHGALGEVERTLAEGLAQTPGTIWTAAGRGQGIW